MSNQTITVRTSRADHPPFDNIFSGGAAYFSFCVDAGFRIKNVTIDGAWAAFNQSSGSKTNSAAGQVGVGGFGMVAWFVGIVGVGLLDLVSTL
jgi:hypothetical protein